MKAILDGPVGAHVIEQLRGRTLAGGDEVAGAYGGLIGEVALGPHLDQRGKLRPLLAAAQGSQQGRVVNRPGLTDFEAAMGLIDGCGRVVGIGGEVALDQIVKEQDNILVKQRLVLLEREHIVGALLHKGLGYLGLAAAPRGPPIDGHDATLQLQRLKEFRQGGDLVGLVVHLTLPQHQVIARRPGTDHMNGRLARRSIVGTAQLFAVYSHHFALGQLLNRGNPVQKALLELLGSRRRKTRQKVSCEGMPLGSSRKVANHACLAWSKWWLPSHWRRRW